MAGAPVAADAGSLRAKQPFDSPRESLVRFCPTSRLRCPPFPSPQTGRNSLAWWWRLPAECSKSWCVHVGRAISSFELGSLSAATP